MLENNLKENINTVSFGVLVNAYNLRMVDLALFQRKIVFYNAKPIFLTSTKFNFPVYFIHFSKKAFFSSTLFSYFSTFYFHNILFFLLGNVVSYLFFKNFFSSYLRSYVYSCSKIILFIFFRFFFLLNIFRFSFLK